VKILVTGSTGQVGSAVVKLAEKQGFTVLCPSSSILDIKDSKKVIEYVNTHQPEAIVHCAAYTQVDKAETERTECWNVNVTGTKNLVDAIQGSSTKFIYLSTDYVFSGDGNKPFKENDRTNPINYYGKTKFEGEQIVRDLTSHFIVRISWVYGMIGKNFVKTMVNLSKEHSKLSVVSDQIGSPTNAEDLSYLLLDMVMSEKYGTYHATNEGYCSWAEFASQIFEYTGCNTLVVPVPSSEYKSDAIRPLNSKLDKQKLTLNFSPLPNWDVTLKKYLEQVVSLNE
jgi:dTDP-4-dehydrorhamnose reductase